MVVTCGHRRCPAVAARRLEAVTTDDAASAPGSPSSGNSGKSGRDQQVGHSSGGAAGAAGAPVGGAPGSDASAGVAPAENPKTTEHGSAGGLALAMVAYTVARLLLVAVVAALIILGGRLVDVRVPLLVAAVFGVLIAMPLGMVLFKSLRLRVNRQIELVDADRRRKHENLQARLRGDTR
ncbi:hypothetical protein GCM10009624_00960 [Gordonia sinesedis]